LATLFSSPYGATPELVHHESFKTREEAKQALFDYIEVFYNRQQRHSAINYKSPEQFGLMQTA